MSKRNSWVSSVLAALVIAAVFLGVAFGVWKLLSKKPEVQPHPPKNQCVATANDHSVWISLEQAENVAIITGESIRRGLEPRAATIALATAYQESGLRNLNYGDRDSLGLFQQRPSYGWGTEEQIMDPWYSSGRFYEELVKFKGWQTGDITEYAQKVQRSAYPDAYRKHETNARTLASVFTGHSPGGLTCVNTKDTVGSSEDFVTVLQFIYGDQITIQSRVEGETTIITVTSPTETTAWAVAATGMGLISTNGVYEVNVAGQTWTKSDEKLATWSGPTSPTAAPYTTEFKLKTK